MKTKLKKYSAYKDSGVEWLGDVPKHWDVRKLKYLLELITNKNSDVEGIKVGLENIEGQTGRYIETKGDFEGDGVLFAENDILYGKLRPYLAKVFLSTFSGFAVGDFFVLRPNTFAFPKYFQYRLLEQDFTGFSNGSTFGAKMPRVNWGFLANLKFSLPPLDEQQAIADFLDCRTGAIDELIAKKERVIELLREKRTAIISHAVTKGLNPDAEMKDSGVDWLGEIPEHWEVKKLKWAYKSIGSGDGISPDDIEPIGKYPVYGGNGIMGYTEYFNSNGDDIIIGRVGAKCGIVYLISGKKWISDNALRLDIDKCDKRYLSQFLIARNLNQLANQNAQPLITGSMVGNQFIPFPPHLEQRAITDYLDRETAKIDALIAKVAEAIEKLKEYRTALISAAVTGKIKIFKES